MSQKHGTDAPCITAPLLSGYAIKHKPKKDEHIKKDEYILKASLRVNKQSTHIFISYVAWDTTKLFVVYQPIGVTNSEFSFRGFIDDFFNLFGPLSGHGNFNIYYRGNYILNHAITRNGDVSFGNDPALYNDKGNIVKDHFTLSITYEPFCQNK